MIAYVSLRILYSNALFGISRYLLLSVKIPYQVSSLAFSKSFWSPFCIFSAFLFVTYFLCIRDKREIRVAFN